MAERSVLLSKHENNEVLEALRDLVYAVDRGHDELLVSYAESAKRLLAKHGITV